MTIGSGIAIASMWAAVAIVSLKNSEAAILIGFCAMAATIFVTIT